jgi:zinc protease
MFIGHIGTFPDKFADVKAGFLREINRIRDEVPTKEEVENVKKYLTGALPFNLVTCSDVAGMLLLIDRHRLGETYLADYVKAVEAVTPEDVRDVARKYLHPERLILVAAGPVDATGKPLAGKMKD